MISTLTIVRYPKWFAWAGVLSMAILRLPLWIHPNIGFWKLMGSGKNGSFDKTPDYNQWALLTVLKSQDATSIQKLKTNKNQSEVVSQLYGSFIMHWWQFWNCELWTILLCPIEGHGCWDGQEVFGKLQKQTDYEGEIAVLTRATIRFNKLNAFWKNVAPVANKMNQIQGFKSSFGIGEIPWIKQATFSIWDSKADMRNFAYKMQEHATVIQKTKKENWYSEEMFVRFIPMASFGTVRGIDPLKRKPYLANNS